MGGVTLPLEGVWVVEMGSLLAGPFCGQLVADFGVENEARENVVTVEDAEIGPFPMQNVVPRLTEMPGKVRCTGPALGQHNGEVYGEVLGLSGEERKGLREKRIV